MLDNGYVYVLMNPSMDNLVKIGKTTREPEERAKELSSTTGVPTPFVVVYDCYFESCSEAEIFVHTYLENKGFRVSSNREFFEIPIKDAIDSIMKAKEHFGKFETTNQHQDFDEEGIFSSNSEDDFLDDLDYKEEEIVVKEPWEELFYMAETYYYGHDDEIVDYEEAMIYYLKAIKLGSIEAYNRIGIMYERGEGVRENHKKAFQYFKEGAKKDDIKCYAEMAKLFSNQDNIDNALKSWKKYFELSNVIDYIYTFSYIKFIQRNNLDIKYIDKIQTVIDKIIDWTSSDIEKMIGTENEDLIPYYKDDIVYFQKIKGLKKILPNENTKKISTLERLLSQKTT